MYEQMKPHILVVDDNAMLLSDDIIRCSVVGVYGAVALRKIITKYSIS